jgi:hypothetical protein
MRRLHAVLALLSVLFISGFLIATVAGDLSGDVVAMTASKRVVAWLLLPLVLCLAGTGGVGAFLARGGGGGLIDVKKRRMRVIALNGVSVLAPLAIILWRLAEAHRFDSVYWVLQVVELLAGGVNLVLILMNVRDGLRLSGRLRPVVPHPAGGGASPRSA